jgi:ParB family chromosome partitioning protein
MPKTAAAKRDAPPMTPVAPPTVTMIPISDLLFASDAPKELGLQVRKSNDEEGLPTLEASIRAHGVIVPLVTKAHKGKLYVTAGNRRLKILRAIHPSLDVMVPTVDSDAYAGDPREIAMATNVALPPHPVDRYEVIAALVGEGMSHTDAMLRFGMTERQYHQTMKLGSLAPSLRDKWRANEMDGAVAQALTMTDNQAEQEKVFAAARKQAGGPPTVYEVRSRLIPDSQRELGKLIEFVGVDHIDAAGLIKQRDWFSTNHIVTDMKAVKKMADAKLVESAHVLLEQGWSWVVNRSDIENMSYYAYGHTQPEGKKGVFTDAQKKKSGCILDIAPDGQLKIDMGRLKPAERKQLTINPGKKAKPKKDSLTNKLAERLSEDLEEAIASAIGASPHVAIAALIAGFASDGHVVDVGIGGGGFNRPKDGEKNFVQVFDGALKASPEARVVMLTKIAAEAISIQIHSADAKSPIDGLGLQAIVAKMDPKALNKALAENFDAKGYFDAVNLDACVAVVRCSMGDDHAAKVSKMKKGDAAKFCATHIPAKGWLPKQLRTCHYSGPVELDAAKKPKPVKKARTMR